VSTFIFAQGFSIIETAWFEMEHQLRLLRPQLSTTNYGMLTLTCFFMHAWKPYACCDTSHVLCVDSAVTLYSLQMLFKKKGRYQRKNLLAVISQTSLKLLPSEGLSGKRVTFHVVAACNNRDHTTKSLYYCTSCSHRLLSRGRATHIRAIAQSRDTHSGAPHLPFMAHRTFEAAPTERPQQNQGRSLNTVYEKYHKQIKNSTNAVKAHRYDFTIN